MGSIFWVIMLCSTAKANLSFCVSVSCLTYTSALKMKLIRASRMSVIVSHKIELYINYTYLRKVHRKISEHEGAVGREQFRILYNETHDLCGLVCLVKMTKSRQ
jgi:hypothetical protein